MQSSIKPFFFFFGIMSSIKLHETSKSNTLLILQSCVDQMSIFKWQTPQEEACFCTTRLGNVKWICFSFFPHFIHAEIYAHVSLLIIVAINEQNQLALVGFVKESFILSGKKSYADMHCNINSNSRLRT